jgi:SAM-dependent methyltransferase
MARQPQRPDPAEDHTGFNRSTYDRIAARYAEHQRRGRSSNEPWFGSLRDEFVARIPPGGLIADLGCGPAIDGGQFAGEGHPVVAMDLSIGMLAIAAQALPARVAQADLRSLPIADGGLGGIWCIAALLHVPHSDTDRVLQEFRRTLRADGCLALVTAVGEVSRFEGVPYAEDEQRWFVYRGVRSTTEQLHAARLRVRSQAQLSGGREWLAVLATSDP